MPLADVLAHVCEPVRGPDGELRHADGGGRGTADRAHARVEVVRTCTRAGARPYRHEAGDHGAAAAAAGAARGGSSSSRSSTRRQRLQQQRGRVPGPGVGVFFFFSLGAGIVFGLAMVVFNPIRPHAFRKQQRVVAPGCPSEIRSLASYKTRLMHYRGFAADAAAERVVRADIPRESALPSTRTLCLSSSYTTGITLGGSASAVDGSENAAREKGRTPTTRSAKQPLVIFCTLAPRGHVALDPLRRHETGDRDVDAFVCSARAGTPATTNDIMKPTYRQAVGRLTRA